MKRVIFSSIFIALFSFGFFFSSNLVSAEITHPYTIDEKPQVLFGDSIIISTSTPDQTASSTYQGLENYKQDYVGGYTHFTFTYTHDRCCFAGYPPRIYITDVDPRSTSTPIEKINFLAIDAPSLYWYQPTDWYLIDIQFDSAGFTIIIKQEGINEVWNAHTDVTRLTAKDWVSLTNYYLMSPSTQYSMSFTPVPITDVSPTQTIDPVIIIPGIMGSATKNGKLVIDPILHTYDDLIATLGANGYEEGKDLFTFPYEWRDSNVLTANLLKDKINEIKTTCDCSKVDLVAHSMGGLVAREYIQSGQYQNDVDQVIFLGTPHNGAPKAYLQWEAGEFPPGIREFLNQQIFVSESRRNGYVDIFDYIHNRPILSVQELLPTFDYLKDKNTGLLRIYPNNYPRNTFLENLNNNISTLLNSGVKITNIIGDTGNSTIESILITPSFDLKKWIHGEMSGFELGAGDSTVTYYSSTLDSFVSNEKWGGVSHGDLPRETEARVFNLLTGKIASSVIYLTPIEKIFSIQLQSPIDVVITAPDGKKIGKKFSTGGEYNEIPGAFYSGFNNGDDEYITIPNPLDGEYKIEVQGTGNGGKYGVLTSYISDNFVTITETAGITKPNQITELDTVVNNTNPQNLETERVITSEVLLNDINGAYDLKWIKDAKTRNALVKQVNGAMKFSKKIDIIKERQPDGSIKEKRIERFEIKVNKILSKLFIIELQALFKKKMITQDAFNLIKSDVEYLINN